MTYYQRQKQLLNTLNSFRSYKRLKVVIVDDNSPDDIELPKLPFEVTILKLCEKLWINPAVTFNIGLTYALSENPERVIIQNAECYHKGNILGYIREHLNEGNYLSFAAYSLGKDEDINIKKLNSKGAVSNGDSAWYNHSRYRPEALHFCSAITADNLRKINGFDERFANGLGYEDNYLIHQIKMLGLKIQIVDNPFVFHQYHYDVKAFDFNQELYNKTGVLCRELKAEKTFKAKHIVTDDF